MNDADINNFRMQLMNNYRNAINENIKNNTYALVDQDITSLLKKPPLDSMDMIKTKLIGLAKKNKTILNTDELSNILDNYRKYLLECCDEIKTIRIKELSKIVNSAKLDNNDDIIKINKKDFVGLNRKIKKIIKDRLEEGLNSYILKKIDNIFSNDLSDEIKNKMILDVTKYIKSSYKKQILENLDIKILVKDTILINGTKEQSERYLFTLNNSRLLNENA